MPAFAISRRPMASRSDDIVRDLRALNTEYLENKQLVSQYEDNPYDYIDFPDSLADTDFTPEEFRKRAAELRSEADIADNIAAKLDALKSAAASAEESNNQIIDKAYQLAEELQTIDEAALIELDLPVLF